MQTLRRSLVNFFLQLNRLPAMCSLAGSTGTLINRKLNCRFGTNAVGAHSKGTPLNDDLFMALN